MKKSLLSLLCLLVLIGCTRNNKATKSLVGEWKALSVFESFAGYSAERVSEDGLELTLVFNKCTIKRNGYCSLDWTEGYSSEVEFTDRVDYKVTSSGNTLEMKSQDGTGVLVEFDILELTDESLILDLANDPGKVTLMTFERQ